MTKKTRLATFGGVAAVVLGATTAQAQVYGGYLPPPPYASSGADQTSQYTRGGEACGGFTLAGARAGVTVLGVDLDAGAGLRIGTSAGCRHRQHEVRYAPPPPPTYSPPLAYAPVQSEPAYDPAPAPYGYAQPCGCDSAPMYRQPSRYGW